VILKYFISSAGNMLCNNFMSCVSIAFFYKNNIIPQLFYLTQSLASVGNVVLFSCTVVSDNTNFEVLTFGECI